MNFPLILWNLVERYKLKKTNHRAFSLWIYFSDESLSRLELLPFMKRDCQLKNAKE